MGNILPGAALLAGLAGMLIAPMVSAEPAAQFPALIRLVVPFPPGGSNDVIARSVAPLLSKRLGNSVIVDNRAGAAGVIGSDTVARAPADASTLLLTSSTFLTTVATQSTVPYDPVSAFAPVAMIAQGPMLLAVPALAPFKSPADLIAAARRHPGVLNYGSAGIGSIGHMSTELFSGITKIRMVHIPYKGAANALIDLASGQIGVMISNYSSLVSQIKSGKVRPLAVTSQRASPAFPDLPPLSQVAPGYAVEIWVSVFAPAGTPAQRLDRLNREINEIARTPELRMFLDPEGAAPVSLSPTALAARIKEDLALWKRIATERSIKID
jgi:tripartite-type tricarboxylate transporter receptor subunit TctC